MKTVKKPTKAHKNKKVVKAHQGMAHVPKKQTQATTMTPRKKLPTGAGYRITPPSKPVSSERRNPQFAQNAISRVQDLLNQKTRGPIAPRPQAPTIQQPKPVRQPAVIKPARPTPIQSDAGGGRGQAINIRQPYTPRKLTSREKRRRDNFFKSEFDEMRRQANKNRRPRRPRPLGGIQTPNLLGEINVATPYDPLVRPEVSYPQQVDPRIFRNKGGVVKKKYAETKTLKQGGYISRAKYGSVDNLKKKK